MSSKEYGDKYSPDELKDAATYITKYIDKNHMDEPTYQLLKSQFFQLYTQRFEMFNDNLKRVNFFTELQAELLKEHAEFFIESRLTGVLLHMLQAVLQKIAMPRAAL